MHSKPILLALACLLVAGGVFLGRATAEEELKQVPTVKVERVVMGGIDLDRFGQRFYTATLYFPDCGATVNFRIDGPTGAVGPAEATRNATPWWKRISGAVKAEGIALEPLPTREFTVPKKLMDDVIALAELQAKLAAESARISKEVQAAGLLHGAAEHAGGIVSR